MKSKKTNLISIISTAILSAAYSPLALASEYPVTSKGGDVQVFSFIKAAGFNSSTTIGSISALIIEAVLGLLGIIFVALLVYSGFQWMTAEGNEEKIEKAKSTITRAIIGLAIVIAAYSITYFVFNALNGAAEGG
jgi:hypothetical protein